MRAPQHTCYAPHRCATLYNSSVYMTGVNRRSMAAASYYGRPAAAPPTAARYAAADAVTGRWGPRLMLDANRHRIQQRLKEISYGKGTREYAVYSELVPRDARNHAWRYSKHPATPDVYQSCSKRSFSGQVRVWRRALHAFYDTHTVTGRIGRVLRRYSADEGVMGSSGNRCAEDDSDNDNDNDDGGDDDSSRWSSSSDEGIAYRHACSTPTKADGTAVPRADAQKCVLK